LHSEVQTNAVSVPRDGASNVQPSPGTSESDTRTNCRALDGKSLRCTGYVKIIEAVEHAQQNCEYKLYGKVMFKYVNKPIEKIDGLALVTGEEHYTNDFSFTNMLHVSVLHSPFPHASMITLMIPMHGR